MSDGSLVFFTHNADSTKQTGALIAKHLIPGDVVCLNGDLGAGKTTLIKGMVSSLLNIDPLEVTSPTFTYLHIYSNQRKIYHFDLYRFSSSEEFLLAGFDDFLYQNEICFVEWPDRLPQNLSYSKVCIDIEYLSAEERKITMRRL
jgi:tRNA threonylcarbamoyladenosine biosynthesis protein TsaE